MSEHFDNLKPARLLIWIMKVYGLWNFENHAWNPIYRCYGWLLHFHFTFLFIVGMYINVFMAQSLGDLSDALYISLTEIALLVKVLNVMLKCRKGVEFLQIFEHNSIGIPQSQAEIDIVSTAQQGFTRLRNLHVTGSMLALLFSGFPPFFTDAYILPFPCWMPFDYKNRQNFYYAYCYVMIAMSVTAISNYTLDLFQSYLLLHLSIYFKLLGKRLENFGYKGNDDENILNGYFKFHGFVAGLAKDCERFLSFPVFIQMVLSAFVLCFTVYKLRITPFTENPSGFVMFVVFALTMSLQIYLPCNYGNELTISANNLTNAIYDANWTHLPLHTQKKIFIYMEYLKQPVVVRAGKIINIGLGVFSQTMNNAYRLYALLLNIET